MSQGAAIMTFSAEVTSITPGTGATSIAKAEDAAHSSGDVGVMALVVRNDVRGTLAGTDLDYAPFQVNASGDLRVDGSAVTQPVSLASVPSHAVTNVGTFAVQATLAAGAASIGKAEDVASADADVGVPSMAVRKATPANTSGTDGDYEFLQMSVGRLWTSSTIDAALPAGANVIGAVTQSGTWNVGTITTVTTVSTVTAVSDAQVQGKAAHDAASSGNPVLLGADGRRARATAVSTDGDATRLTSDRYGRLNVVGVDLTIAVVQATASGDTSLIGAPAGGSRLKILRVEASNSHATTAVTAGLKSTSLNGGAVFGKRYLPAAGGAAVWNFPGGHLMCGDAEAFSVNLSAGSATIEFTVYYETIAT